MWPTHKSACIHANFQLIKSGRYASTRLAEVIARGAARAARGEAPRKLGGSGGMPPRKFLQKACSLLHSGAIFDLALMVSVDTFCIYHTLSIKPSLV